MMKEKNSNNIIIVIMIIICISKLKVKKKDRCKKMLINKNIISNKIWFWLGLVW